MSAPLRFQQPSSSPAPERPALRSLPQTAGFADAFGDRQLVFDPTVGASLEVLHFKREFSESAEFEWALRSRVDSLDHIQHASLATIHSVDRLSDTELALVSRYTAGKRVAELLPRAHGPAFALELIRLVTPALATLHRAGEGMAHGAVSAERIVVTRDGRLVLVEHVLGGALEALRLSRDQLLDLGLVVPPGRDPVQFDERTDLGQLAFIALSLLLGRRLDPADYPAGVPALLDEFASSAGSPTVAAKLRSWIERAMQLSPRSFASAREAQAGINDLPDDSDVQVAAVVTGSAPVAPVARVPPAAAAAPVAPPPAMFPKGVKEASSRPEVHPPAKAAGKRRHGMGNPVTWAIGGLLIAGTGVGAYFAMPLLTAPGSTTQPPPATAAIPNAGFVPAPEPPAASALTAPSTTPAPTPTPAAVTSPQPLLPSAVGASTADTAGLSPTPPVPTPAPPRPGNVKVVSPMDLEVFENGKLLGSGSGPISITEGTRAIDLVNETLGFRLRQSVAIRPGQTTTINIAAPNGRISINAVPWAEVEIDGKPAGETPLANVSLPIGTHEITFRHPQLGVRKQTVIVKVDGLTRVTQTFQPGSSK